MTTGVSNLMLESPLTKLANSRHKRARILQSQTWHYGAPRIIVIIAGNLPASTDTWVVYEGALLDSNTAGGDQWPRAVRSCLPLQDLQKSILMHGIK